MKCWRISFTTWSFEKNRSVFYDRCRQSLRMRLCFHLSSRQEHTKVSLYSFKVSSLIAKTHCWWGCEDSNPYSQIKSLGLLPVESHPKIHTFLVSKLVLEAGIEPATKRIWGVRSTTELHKHCCKQCINIFLKNAEVCAVSHNLFIHYISLYIFI